MCTCSALFWLKAFSHSVQWNGRSPVHRNWLGLANALSHVSHLNTRGFWELSEGPAWCVNMCVARLKAFLQTRQPWTRSLPWTSLLWCISTAADEKVRSQSRHWCAGLSFSGWLLGVRWAETSVTCSKSEVSDD
uniref:Secreted protein n=1 Tax=Castor canadensis TaxID=51338 RepID=A0A8C0XRM6_CASCN